MIGDTYLYQSKCNFASQMNSSQLMHIYAAIILVMLSGCSTHTNSPRIPITRSSNKITIETLEAAKPPRVVIASVTPIKQGVHVVAFASTDALVSTFMRNLSEFGISIPKLLEIRQINACGWRESRFELEIEGDNSQLVVPNSLNEQTEITLAPYGENFKCKVLLTR